MKTIAFVIPCYNEEVVLPGMLPVFCRKLEALKEKGLASDASFVMLVNDGSRDETWRYICEASKQHPHVKGISLSRNRGHQYALLAGLMEAKAMCDAVVSLDCDGQDDIDVVDEMIRAYEKGNEIVYGVRSSRETDTWFKRFTAESFYKFMQWMGVEVIYNHADYRLASSLVLNELEHFQETHLFLRGLFPLVGYRHAEVYYTRQRRRAGESHYPFFKMLSFAVDGITSLSVRPLRLIVVLGAFLIAIGLVTMSAWLLHWLFNGGCIREAFYLMVSLLSCGIQLLALGVVGEYIGKIFIEVKKRPRYIIAERT